MRLTTVRTGGTTRAARMEGDRLVLLEAPDVGALLAAGPDAARAGTGQTVEAAGADLAPLVTRPGKIVCVGLNYARHVQEMGREMPEHPSLFAKYAEALIGPGDDIVAPPEVTSLDWEAELVVVVGRPVRRADRQGAAEAIAGYTVGNDVSARDWQYRSAQWLQGKTWESTTPLGPVLVTPDELDAGPDLEIGCSVDGEVRQRSRTSDLIFDPPTIVSYVSTIVTLQPGDVIFTGTPGGVGAGMDPPCFLASGQVVRTWIEGIGELVNPVGKG